MTTSVGPLLPRPSRPGLVIAIAVLRGLGTTILLSIVYVVSPLERMATIPLWAIVVGGTLILAAVTIYQVRSILGSPFISWREGRSRCRAVIAPRRISCWCDLEKGSADSPKRPYWMCLLSQI